MKKIVLLIAVVIAFQWCAAQVNNNSVYFELFGPGLASFNFDKRFEKKNDGWGYRVGIGGVGGKGDGFLSLPIGINYITGNDDRHFFEVGLNYTFVQTDGSIFDFGNGRTKSFATLNFGYRSQPKNKGFQFRVAANPIITNGYFMPYYFGLSFGYKF